MSLRAEDATSRGRARHSGSFDRPELTLGALILIPTSRAADGFRRITYVVDADHVLRRIPYGLIASDVGFSEDIYLSEERLVFFDGLNRLAFGVENGPRRSRAIVLLHVRGYANILVTALHKDCGGTLRLLDDIINQVKIIIHLG